MLQFYFGCIDTVNHIFPGARGKKWAPVLIVLFTQNECEKGEWDEEKLISNE